MKLIDVGGRGDYVATEFEQLYDEKDYLNLWNRAMEKENNKLVLEDKIEDYSGEKHKVEFHIKAYQFGDVDKEFIKFVRNEVQDYDIAKHMNFYIVEQ